MGRYARDKRDLPTPRPVKKIELSEKHLFLRLAAVILLVILGMGTIGYALFSMLHTEEGLTEIEANNGSLADVAGEFLFQYNLGAGELSATAENKALTLLYGELTRKAYMIFAEQEEFPETHNLAYLNHHLNEVITVDEALYEALAVCMEGPERILYLAPVYEIYASVYHSAEDWEAAMADPLRSEEQRALVAEWMDYIRDPSMIDLELKTENRVELHVAPEYQQYMQENGEGTYLGFGWMKNAFVIDYLAGQLEQAGFVHGSLSGRDGFARNLDKDCKDFHFPLYRREGNTVFPTEPFTYDGAVSIVYLRDFPLTDADRERYYVYEDGEIRGPYIDPRDGMNKAASDMLLGYARGAGQSCGKALMALLKAYLDDSIEESRLKEFESLGYEYIK